MTGSQLFFFFVLPTIIGIGAWIAVLLHERVSRSERPHPGE